MTDHPMTWGLAGRITVWLVFAVLLYAGLILFVARVMAWVSTKYPRPYYSALRKGMVVDPLPEIPERITSVPTIPDYSDTEFQQRARKAESLGFIDDDESGPWIEPKRTA